LLTEKSKVAAQLVRVAAWRDLGIDRPTGRRGSHFIFTNPGIPELINLQDVRGQAKAYQIRQLLKLVERYNLQLGDSEE